MTFVIVFVFTLRLNYIAYLFKYFSNSLLRTLMLKLTYMVAAFYC